MLYIILIIENVVCFTLYFWKLFSLIRPFHDFISQPSVDIKTVLSQLMERLSNYAASSAEVLPEFLQVEAFSKLSKAIGKVILFF